MKFGRQMSETIKHTRSCGTCKRCCEGWLTGEGYGHKFKPGTPCHFLSTEIACTIYESRPKMCSEFNCEWVLRDFFPEWMKPNQSNVIITLQKSQGFKYYYVRETGQPMDSRVLSWLVTFCLTNGRNMCYVLDNSLNFVGSPEFMEITKNAIAV